MPTFSVKDILLGTTLVAAGAGGLAAGGQVLSPGEWGLWILLVCFCFVLMGAGLFAPFKKKWLGALIGFLLLIAISLFLAK